MVQAVKEPNIVGNQVAFNALGVIPGEVTLEGELYDLYVRLLHPKSLIYHVSVQL